MSTRRLVKRILRRAFSKRLNREQVSESLRRLGVRQGGSVLVHSSFTSLGYLKGGPEAFIEILRDVIGPSGTLLFPTHSWHLMNAGNRRFDVRNTPSGVGVLTEVFRQLPGVIRSHHPTHSVAVSGQNSDWFTEGHLTATTPCGAGTPYEKLCQAEGQILFLGTTLRSNTTFHTAEALAEAPYLMESSAEEFEIVGEDGAIKSCRVRMHAQRIGRRFDSLIEPLEETGILRKGPVGQSASLLVDAGPMVAWTVSRLRENPSFLLRSSH